MAYVLGSLRHHRMFGRRHPRRVVVVALAALAVIGAAGGIVAVHRAVTRVAAPAEVPVIHADAEPTRKRPDNPGGLQIPGQGTLGLDGGHGDSKVEQLLPPPEAPLPRPAPVEPMVATPPPPPPATSAPVPAEPPAASVPVATEPPVLPATPPPAASVPVAAEPQAMPSTPPAAAARRYWTWRLP